MKTSFVIDGGAGRLVSAIPALEKYASLNPDDDFVVLTAAWDNLLWSHPVLQERVYNLNTRGVFKSFMKDYRIVSPEPYRNSGYINQRLHLTEAFDQEINCTLDHSDLSKPNLFLMNYERAIAREMLNEWRKTKKKQSVVVIQPYGSAMKVEHGRPMDDTFRSLDVDFALQLIHELSKDHVVVYFGDQDYYHPGDKYSVNPGKDSGDLRMMMALIAEADYFVGVDSVGQHIARAFDKPGTVIMGSTFEENVSYPDHFKIYRNKFRPVYAPIRLSSIDFDFANRLNEKTVDFNQEDLEAILKLIHE